MTTESTSDTRDEREKAIDLYDGVYEHLMGARAVASTLVDIVGEPAGAALYLASKEIKKALDLLDSWHAEQMVKYPLGGAS